MADKTVVKFKEPGVDEKQRRQIPCLIVVEGNYVGEVYRMEKSSLLIGRGEEVDLYLAEEGISRQHARIDQQENSFTLSDLGSTNGTYVNGLPIEQAVLRDGDKIRFGDVLLRFAFQDSIDVKYQEDLRNMAMRDGLTKVFNRRYFVESLNREVSYATRQRMPITCLMFDIDYFKKVNDGHGHQAGDMVLKTLANVLSKEVRGYDILARYGGEEFVILLRGTALQNSLIFAERVRKLIADMDFEYEGKKIPVTISIGLASLDPDHPQSPEDLIRQADRFLYQAKKNGRNRISSALDTDVTE